MAKKSSSKLTGPSATGPRNKGKKPMMKKTKPNTSKGAASHNADIWT